MKDIDKILLMPLDSASLLQAYGGDPRLLAQALVACAKHIQKMEHLLGDWVARERDGYGIGDHNLD